MLTSIYNKQGVADSYSLFYDIENIYFALRLSIP